MLTHPPTSSLCAYIHANSYLPHFDMDPRLWENGQRLNEWDPEYGNIGMLTEAAQKAQDAVSMPSLASFPAY